MFGTLFLKVLTSLPQCGEKGHYANHCRNRNVPGNRGGTERVRRYVGDE
jgi:cleavage and polyadenylation specificity factor subunit 4